MAGGVTGQPTPTAADVQQTQAGSQTQSLANPIQFQQLRRGEIVAFGEEGTGILHIRIEHCFEEIVAKTVRTPPPLPGAPESWRVGKKSGEQGPDVGKP